MPIPEATPWVCIPVDLHPPTVSKQWLEEFPSLKIKVNADGSWSMKTQENYGRLAKPGIRLSLLARGIDFDSRGLALLHQLPSITASTTTEQLRRFAELRQWQASLRPDAEPLWSRFAGELQICLDSELEQKLREFQSEGEGTDSLWLAEVSNSLSRRLALMRLLFAQRHTKHAMEIENFRGFLAARDLMVNTSSSFTIYFYPILLLDSPWVGGYAVLKPDASIIRLLTTPERGRPYGWTDQLDSFRPPYAGSAGSTQLRHPTESLDSREKLLKWWAAGVSELLWVVADPTRYVDKDCNYDPSVQLGVTLTVERIFVTAIEILSLKTKDELLRKILLFDLLDLLEGHGMGGYETNLSYHAQHDAWVRVKATLPDSVSNAFSPVVDGAFDALQTIDSGFWSISNLTNDDSLQITRKSGIGQETVSLDRARAEYIRVLRNSHHGFRKIAKNPRSLSYLANHTGALDNRIPDLVWWYLIRILDNPSEIAPIRPNL